MLFSAKIIPADVDRFFRGLYRT